MRRLLALFAVLTLAWGARPPEAAAATDARMTEAQVQRLNSLTKQAERLATSDPLRAYLALVEAVRLEQLWTSNTLGEDSPAELNLRRFSEALVRREDAGLLRILHSRQVPKGEKLGLLGLLQSAVEQQGNPEE